MTATSTASRAAARRDAVGELAAAAASANAKDASRAEVVAPATLASSTACAEPANDSTTVVIASLRGANSADLCALFAATELDTDSRREALPRDRLAQRARGRGP